MLSEDGLPGALKRLAYSSGRVMIEIWPAYALGSVLILVGFKWGLPNGRLVPLSWQADENAARYATSAISFPFFHASWLPWGTALFYQVYVLKTIVSLGGLLYVGDRGILVLGRFMVYASALGAITALYLLGRSLFDVWTGRAAALLLAVMPGFVITAHYFKVEVAMSFWLVLTLLATFKMRRTGTIRDVAIVGLLTGYTASTQYSGGLVLAPVVTALIQAKPVGMRRALAILGGTVVAGFLFGTPYALLTPRAFYSGLRMDTLINHQGMAYTPARPPALIDYALNVAPYSITVPILIVAAFGLVVALVRERARLLPLWAMLAVYAVLLSADNSRIVRATTPVLPIVALLAAYGLAKLRGLRWMRIPSLGVLALVTCYAFLFSLAYVQAFASVDPRIQASQWIERRIPAGTRIAIGTTHYLDVPQLANFGYSTVELRGSAARLNAVRPRYLVLSDMSLLPASQALTYNPATSAFLSVIRSNYCELARFENSQRLWWINTKPRDGSLSFDWLYPNPRITILERRDGSTGCRRLDAYQS